MTIFRSDSCGGSDPTIYHNQVIDLVDLLGEYRQLLLKLHDAYFSKKKHPKEKRVRNRKIFIKSTGLLEVARIPDPKIATRHRMGSTRVKRIRCDRLWTLMRLERKMSYPNAISPYTGTSCNPMQLVTEEVLFFCDLFHVMYDRQVPHYTEEQYLAMQSLSVEALFKRLQEILSFLRGRARAINLDM